MSFFGEVNQFSVSRENSSLGPTTGFAENFDAAWGEARSVDTLVAEGKLKNDIRAENLRRIEEQTGLSYDEAIAPYMGPQEAVGELMLYTSEETVDGITPQDRAVDEFIRNTDKPDGYVLSSDFDSVARQRALDMVAKNADIYARSTGAMATVGQFLGAAGGQFTDPLVLATLPIGASSGARVLIAAGIEAALAGGVTAAQAPVVSKWRERLGLEDNTLETIGYATLAGGILGGGARALGKIFGKLSNRELVELHRDLVPNPSKDEVLMIEHLSRKADEAEDFALSGASEEEFSQNLSNAVIHVNKKGSAILDDDIELPARPKIEEIPDIEKQGNPLDPVAAQEMDNIRATFRQMIDDGDDFDVEIGVDDDGNSITRKISEIIKEHDEDSEFVSSLEACA